MRNIIKKVLVPISFVILLLVCKVPNTYAAEFSDIKGSYAQDAILELVNKGILSGDEYGKFNPTGKVTRQDFAIVLAKSLKLDVSTTPASPTFSDVSTSHYSYSYIEAVAKAQLIEGFKDGTFRGNRNVTREEMATIFVNALGQDVKDYGSKLTFDDKTAISDWAKDAVGYAVEMGLINNGLSNVFNPKGSATREDVASMTVPFIKKAEELNIIKSPEPPVYTNDDINFNDEVDQGGEPAPGEELEQDGEASTEEVDQDEEASPEEEVGQDEGTSSGEKVDQDEEASPEEVDQDEEASPEEEVDQDEEALPEEEVDQDEEASPEEEVDQDEEASSEEVVDPGEGTSSGEEADQDEGPSSEEEVDKDEGASSEEEVDPGEQTENGEDQGAPLPGNIGTPESPGIIF
ncbi:S-layer homology domain-containing protein [Cytobacillus praedii]|uniref:S-layer homology domain-containing protein n=1 Tax=Cytobacillus praedii TaxID=1742358 RepID=UPI003F804AA3